MKPFQKTILITCCLLGMGISFAYNLRQDPDIAGEIKAPVYLNIEIDKTYMGCVSIIATMNPGDFQIPLSAEISSVMRPVVLYGKIKHHDNQTPFIYSLFVQIPRESAHEILYAIDGISVFIGNKMFYFSHSDVIELQGKEHGAYLLYELPGLEYKKSIITALLKQRPWINWYGDFNFAVKTVGAFFVHPGKFAIIWLFLISFLIVCRSDITNIYYILQKRKGHLLELLMLSLIVLAGFILRFNGYVRYSSTNDELYSACEASNPSNPFLSTFEDPGNPPLYFVLLRLWFTVFGWTEQSGRFFSVVLGSAAIISLYFMVKRIANKRAAFLAASYMAASAYLIGFSQEMRPYILEVFIVSIVTFRFLVIVQERDLSFTNLIWYIIPSVLLVNTHYYGSLFIFANFFFFIVYSIKTKTFSKRKTILFFAGNVIIAFSLLPFFIHTALRRALLDPRFNTWISKPGLELKCIAIFILLSLMLYLYLRKNIFQKILSEPICHFFDYTIFVTSVVYLTAFGISLYRPLLIIKYLIFLRPLLIAAIAIIIINLFTSGSKLIGGLCIVFAFVWMASGYGGEPGGDSDVYKESQAYITSDSEAHSRKKSGQFDKRPEEAIFYGYKHLPLYTPGDTYDLIYFNPLHSSQEEMYSEIAKLGISAEKVLRIYVNESQCVFKIYSGFTE